MSGHELRDKVAQVIWDKTARLSTEAEVLDAADAAIAAVRTHDREESRRYLDAYMTYFASDAGKALVASWEQQTAEWVKRRARFRDELRRELEAIEQATEIVPVAEIEKLREQDDEQDGREK